MIAAALSAGACTPSLEYAPPPQRTIPEGEDPATGLRILRMNNPSLAHRIVQDIDPGAADSAWLWTHQRPRFRMRLEPEPWIYHVGFTVAGVVLKAVGPVTVTFVVNDRVVGRERYTVDRHFEFETPVSEEILRLAEPVIFGFDVDPVLVSERDGAKLGVLLESIGFRKPGR